MKKIFLFGFLISSIFSNAYAGQLSDDFCGKITGHWHGIFTLKDPNQCKLLNGCTHLVMADVSYVSNNEYHLTLSPAAGHGAEFNISCKDGVITSPINPGNKISGSCNDSNHCLVKYDDPQLSSEMMKD